jgi:hypothetical protein
MEVELENLLVELTETPKIVKVMVRDMDWVKVEEKRTIEAFWVGFLAKNR